MNLSSPTEESAQHEKRKAEEIVASIPLIPEVQAIDVELYTDNAGDPAFQLVFNIQRDVEIGRDFIKRFNDFAATVQTKILHSDLDRFPYTRLKQVA